MKQHAAETLFRHKLLVLLPLLVILPISIAAALRPPAEKWQSFAVVWVDPNRALGGDERLGYTPAINQAQLLNDFLHTRTFALAVLQQTRLASDLSNAAQELEGIHRLWQSVAAWPNSNNFVTITASTDDPQLSYEMASAVVVQFEKVLREQAQAKQATAADVYAATLAKAEQSLNTSRDEFAAYLRAHPELQQSPGRDPLGTLSTAQDPTLARLQAQVNHDSEQYQAARGRVDDIRLAGTTGEEAQRFTFMQVDEPQVSVQPITARRMARIKLPVAGLAVAMMLSAGIAAALIFTNHSVYGANDFQPSDIAVLADVPELRRGPLFRRKGRDAVRQRLSGPARPAQSPA